MSRSALLIALMAALAGCAEVPAPPPAKPGAPPGLVLKPATFDQLPGWRQDHQAAALPAILKSCARIAQLPGERPLGAGMLGGIAADWRGACAAAAKLPAGNDPVARYFVETWFAPFEATSTTGQPGLFTGYYEAELHGSRTRSNRYSVPIYRVPPDLDATKAANGGKYKTRSEIGGGALAGKGLELLWVDDAVDAFFLHVQGSGRVAMDDGRVVRIGYAGDNGHAYASIGRELVARGYIAADKLSMQTIRAWIAANPVQGANLMAQNPRYIFFRVRDGQDDGPVGAQGASLTPGRSLAVDPAFVPLGLLVWVDTADPLDGRKPLRRLFVAQDTGSAIKGPVRGDIFFGFGEAAARQAGVMKASGRCFILVPRKALPPTS